MPFTLRPAVRTDATQILAFITELAEYERARHEVIATVADIERSLFDDGSTVHSLICERDGRAIGFA
ncbi:MAG: GNAT family N-acetyltransferase, partial [Pseudomonas putida]